MWGLFSGKLNRSHPQVRRFGGEFEIMQELLLDSLVQAIAEKVMAKIRPELSGGAPSSRVQPALFSVKEAAVYLGRSEQAVQHLIFQRDLPVVRVGRRVHLDRRGLDAWIEKNKY
jgi:excisionase family DNA binding protein